MTHNGKSLLYIELTKTNYININKIIRYTILYVSDEIEYKIDKLKKNIILNDNLEYDVIPHMSLKIIKQLLVFLKKLTIEILFYNLLFLLFCNIFILL